LATIALNSKRIREICAERGVVTDQDFAHSIGVDKGTASRVLRGQAPGPKFISSVLLTYPVKFEDVFTLVDDAPALAAGRKRRAA